MKLKLTLATASALGLLMGGAALANDGNEAYTSQNGERNTLQIQQNQGTIGNNRVGTFAAPILQQGDDNTFKELQQSGAGYYGVGGNVIEAGKQLGDKNTFTSTYGGSTSGYNEITNMLQQGGSNAASVLRNDGKNGLVGTLRQHGDSNKMSIIQTGDGNQIISATQDGSKNGDGAGTGVNRWNRGTQLWQIGTGNVITEASITGSNNLGAHPTSGPYANVDGYAVLDIKQNGTGNGDVFSIARMTGSNGNQIVIDQFGNHNQFSVIQGDAVSDTRNFARLFQTGDYNEALIDQSGSFNSALMTFDGDSNGLVGLTGVAGALVSGSGGLLFAGTAIQDSSSSLTGNGNSLTYDVVGNSNQFAFAQIGGNNTISGLVGDTGASNGNQAAVLQSGSNNTSSFSQNGGGSNNISVSQ